MVTRTGWLPRAKNDRPEGARSPAGTASAKGRDGRRARGPARGPGSVRRRRGYRDDRSSSGGTSSPRLAARASAPNSATLRRPAETLAPARPRRPLQAASTSTHPTLPHQQTGPSRSTQMCPDPRRSSGPTCGAVEDARPAGARQSAAKAEPATHRDQYPPMAGQVPTASRTSWRPVPSARTPRDCRVWWPAARPPPHTPRTTESQVTPGTILRRTRAGGWVGE